MKLNGSRRLAMQNLGHHFSVFRSHHHAIAPANGGIGCNDQRIAIPVKGQHGVARNLQRIHPFARAGGKFHDVPALPCGKTGIVEVAARARFGHAEQRDRLHVLRIFAKLRRAGFPADEPCELIEGRAGRFHHLGQ